MDITLRGLIKAGDEVGVYNYLFNQRRITAKDYEGILQQSYEMQTNLPPVVNLTVSSRPLIIVGDIHGSRAHFDKFYNKYKLTDDTVLFLGDLVDRGNYSIEILSFVLALQLMRPEKYYLLRGNHEDIRVNNRYGFTNDILSLGDSSLAQKTQKLYEAIPLNFFLHFGGKTYLATHGGAFMDLSVNGTLYDILMHNDKRAHTEIGHQLLWNDPHALQDDTRPSPRGGATFMYGRKHFERFCERFGIEGIIRGHQVQPRLRRDFGDMRHVTVFGSAGSGFVLRVGPGGEMSEVVMD